MYMYVCQFCVFVCVCVFILRVTYESNKCGATFDVLHGCVIFSQREGPRDEAMVCK